MCVCSQWTVGLSCSCKLLCQSPFECRKKLYSIVPVCWHVPQIFQNLTYAGSGGKLLIEGVAAVCELDVHIQLHQTANLHSHDLKTTTDDDKPSQLCQQGAHRKRRGRQRRQALASRAAGSDAVLKPAPSHSEQQMLRRMQTRGRNP